MSSSEKCPTNALPEDKNLGIQTPGVIFAVAPRGNTTANKIPDPWMVDCCAPASVQITSANLSTWACWQWCDLPPSYTNGTSDTSRMLHEFASCVTSDPSYANASVKVNVFHVSAAPRDRAMGDGMVGLATVLGLVVWWLFM